MATGEASPPRGARPVFVRDVMTPDPATLAPDATVAAAVALMSSVGCRHVPVVADGRVVGVVSSKDLRGWSDESLVADAMTRDPATVRPEDPIESAAAIMALRKIGCLIVIEGGALGGILTTYDLLDALAFRLRAG